MSEAFSTELWDQFEEVYKKVATGKEFTASVAEFVHKRAALEKDYARKLSALCKVAEKEMGTTNAAWNSIKDETENISKKHGDLGEALLLQVEEPLQAFIRDTRKNRQTLYDQGKKIIKDLQSAEAKVAASKKEFELARKKQDETKEELERATLNNQQSPAIEKLSKKIKLEQKKSTSADKKYSESVDACRSLQDKFYDEEMPHILEDFQHMESQRLEKLKVCFQAYMELQASVAPEIVSSCDRMRINITNVNVNADLQAFVNEKRTRAPKPERVIYEAYSSELGRCVNQSGGSGAVSTAKITSTSGPEIRSNAPTAVAATSVAAPRAAAAPIAAAAIRGVSKCRGLYDYQATDPNELSFKQGDIITVLQKDPSGWWQGELNGRIGVFPSVEWVEEISDQAAVRKCRALFEYSAENEYELTIHPGDIISVDRDEDGWFCGTNQRGQTGRYPSNYVELL